MKNSLRLTRAVLAKVGTTSYRKTMAEVFNGDFLEVAPMIRKYPRLGRHPIDVRITEEDGGRFSFEIREAENPFIALAQRPENREEFRSLPNWVFVIGDKDAGGRLSGSRYKEFGTLQEARRAVIKVLGSWGVTPKTHSVSDGLVRRKAVWFTGKGEA